MSQTDSTPETPLARWMAENDHDDASLAAAVNIGRTQASRLRRGICGAGLETAKALEGLTGISALSLMERVRSAQDAAA